MTTFTSTPTVQVQSHGRVGRKQLKYATEKLQWVLRYARDPVLFARVKLTRLADPALDRPCIAQMNLDVNGRMVRAQAARPTMREAVDEAHDRLRDGLLRLAGDWEAIRGGRPVVADHEWRHGGIPTDRPSYFPRPVEEREVLRHKSFTLGRLTVDEAAADLQLLGFSFHLFTEAGSRVDTVLYRSDGHAALRLAQLTPRPTDVSAGQVPVTISPQPAPTLRVAEATERLNLTGLPFVFFKDADSGRGRVLYHRYDGHYGLIEPAA